jgi:hypothetical protein
MKLVPFFLPSQPPVRMPKTEYDFTDPRFLFLLERVTIPPEVTTPHRTRIVITRGLPTFGQFYRNLRVVRAFDSSLP